MQNKDNPNQPGSITFSQIISGEVGTEQVIANVVALDNQIGDLDKQILFYCLNAIIHNRVDALPKLQLIDAIKRQLHANQFWAAGALFYLTQSIKDQEIGISPEDWGKIRETLENSESQKCPVCVTTEGLGFLNGWAGNPVDLEEAEKCFREAIALKYTPAIDLIYTPAIANLACVLVLKEDEEQAYKLLTEASTQDCAVNYNTALFHLTKKHIHDANKKYNTIKAIKDLNLLIGHGQISSILLERKKTKNVEFTAETEKKSAEPTARKRLKISGSNVKESEPQPEPRTQGPAFFPRSERQPASLANGRNRFKKAAPNGAQDSDDIDYKEAYLQAKKELKIEKKRAERERARKKEAIAHYTKQREKYKKLKAEISNQAQSGAAITPSEYSAFDQGRG